MSSLERLMYAQLRLLEPEVEYRFAPPRRWRFDFAWPDQLLALEVEGGTWTQGRHTRGKAFEADCEKYNEAVILGWRVLRITTDMVTDGRGMDFVRRARERGRGGEVPEHGPPRGH